MALSLSPLSLSMEEMMAMLSPPVLPLRERCNNVISSMSACCLQALTFEGNSTCVLTRDTGVARPLQEAVLTLKVKPLCL